MIHHSTPDSTETLAEGTKRRSTFYVPLVGAEDTSSVSFDHSLSGLDWSLSDSMSSTDVLSASSSRNSPTSTRYKRYGVVLNRMNTVESDDRTESPLSSLSNIPVSCNVSSGAKVKEKSKTLPQNLTQAATFPPKNSFLLKSTPKISLNYSSGNDSSPSKASSDKKSSSLSFIRRAHSTKLSRSNSLLRSLTHRTDSLCSTAPDDHVKSLNIEALQKILRADNVEDAVREMFLTQETPAKIHIDDEAVHSGKFPENFCIAHSR